MIRAAIATLAGGLCLAAGAGCGGGQGTEPDQGGAASGPRLTEARCGQLEPLVRRRLAPLRPDGAGVSVTSSGTERLSRCTFAAPGSRIAVSLDTASDAHQRFSNRVVEEVQFSGNDPARIPRDVPGVGDPRSANHGAVWTSSSAELLAIRGNRLVIVDFYVAGVADRRLRDGAAGLARSTYAVSR